MLTIKDIQRVVAHIYNVSIADLIGVRRDRLVAEPRLIALWIAGSLLTDKSISQIARAFHRDRTTITHGIRRGREITAQSETHICYVNRIIAELRRKVGL